MMMFRFLSIFNVRKFSKRRNYLVPNLGLIARWQGGREEGDIDI